MAFTVRRAGYPPHQAEAWAHRWVVPATMALNYYQATGCTDIVACWDRDCIRGPCQWVKDRGYFDGTRWFIPEFRQWGLDWAPVRDWAWANGIPTWAAERFVWDNGRLPSSQSEMMDYMRAAGIPYVMEHAAVAAFIDSRPDIAVWSRDPSTGTGWGVAAARGILPWNTATKVAVFYAWWENMNPPERAQFGGNAAAFICSRYPQSWTCSVQPAPAPTLDCSAQGRTAWAASVRLPVCIADRFCADFGRLPRSVDELLSWGSSKGIRCPDGSWNCSGCAPPPQPPPPPPGGGPGQCPAGEVWDPALGRCRPGGGGGGTCQPGQVRILGACLGKTEALVGGALVLILLLRR